MPLNASNVLSSYYYDPSEAYIIKPFAINAYSIISAPNILKLLYAIIV